jgi:predicted O-methyltransferase YrrM
VFAHDPIRPVGRLPRAILRPSRWRRGRDCGRIVARMSSLPPLPAPSPRGRLRERGALRALPGPVRHFYARALDQAHRTGDVFSLSSVSRPANLATLLQLGRGRRRIVELGTCTAWTAIALALNEPAASVTSFDPVVHEQRDQYLELVPAEVRRRVELVAQRGAEGADRADDAAAIELLYVDSTHERAETVAEYEAWRPRMAPGGIVVFDDVGHSDHPGVAEAIAELDLAGEAHGALFVVRL